MIYLFNFTKNFIVPFKELIECLNFNNPSPVNQNTQKIFLNDILFSLDKAVSEKKFLYAKKVFIFKDKHPVQCKLTKASKKPLKCFLKDECVKRDGKKCIKKKVWKYCVFKFNKTCLFTSKFTIQRCYQVSYKGGYKVKCYKSAPKLVKVRKVAGSIKKAKLVKVYFTKH